MLWRVFGVICHVFAIYFQLTFKYVVVVEVEEEEEAQMVAVSVLWFGTQPMC